MPEIAGVHYRWYQGELSHLSPIVFIHGACSDSRVWPKCLRELDAGPMLMLDLPGHGQSQTVCRHSINSYSQGLQSFLAALDIRAPLLVGLGMGASIVVDYISRKPDRVRGFIAVNFAPSYFIPNSVLSAIQTNQYLAAASETMRKGMNGFHHPEVWNELSAIVESQRSSVLAADLQLLHYLHWDPDWESIASVPGLFLYGSGDRLLRGIPTDLPGKLTTRMVPGSGHWLPLEKPEVLSQEILSFSDVIPPSSITA